jgi:hypothetical protein
MADKIPQPPWRIRVTNLLSHYQGRDLIKSLIKGYQKHFEQFFIKSDIIVSNLPGEIPAFNIIQYVAAKINCPNTQITC